MNRSSDTTFSRSADGDDNGAPGAESSADYASSFRPDSGSAAPADAVFRAGPALVADPASGDPGVSPAGFTGQLTLHGADSLGYDETVSALQRLGMLISWAQAQQARVAARLEVLFARDIAEAAGREEPALAMSLAAAEASTVLNIPHMTAMQLISESSRLCTEAPQTLTQLAEGKIAIQHARIILEETHNLPTDIPEATTVNVDGAEPADADTADTAANQSAGESGQLELGLDGMGAPSDQDGGDKSDESSDSADTGVAGGEKDVRTGQDGDPRSPGGGAAGSLATGGVLSVRAAFERDLLAAAEGRTAAGFGRRARRLRESRFPDLIPIRHRQAKDRRRVTFQPLPDGMSCLSAIIAAEKGQAMFAALTGAAKAGRRAGDPRTMDQLRADTLTELLLEGDSRDINPDGPSDGAGTVVEHHTGTVSGTGTGTGTGTSARKRPRRAERHRNQNRSKVRTEVMVLISADTLAGVDEHPAELNGYGPVSAETARAMILEALHWTPLLQDPNTGEILNVGRTRRIPAGLKRWLQARDGTCRFPGCSVNVTHAEIDHTTPFSHGGPTDHGNLEHLCPKHHRFKTLGHWKARQPESGSLVWSSPTGRTYVTDPVLDYRPRGPAAARRDSAPRDGVLQDPERRDPERADPMLPEPVWRDPVWRATVRRDPLQQSQQPSDDPPPF